MRGIRLHRDKRAHLLEVYLSKGYAAAKPLAITYGVTPQYLSKITRDEGRSICNIKKRRAVDAITAMLAEFKIGRSDLLKSRFREHIRFRAIAINRLHNIGLGYGAIAEALNLNVGTVRYWLLPDFRERAKAVRLRYKRKADVIEARP